MKQHTTKNPCPVCNGHRDLPQGKGARCWGFTADDGAYAHCTREEHAGRLPADQAGTYAHKLAGECRCGVTHGASVHGIGEAAHTVVAEYGYHDAQNRLRFQVVRFHPKTFRVRRPDGRGGWTWGLGEEKPLLYRLPEVIDAIAAGDPVWITEGEKDVEALRAQGVTATCNPGGAKKWRDGFNGYFAGAHVVIVRDKDQPGNEHAQQVFAALRDVVQSVRVVEARTGKDAADHLAAGHGTGEFVPVYPVADLRESDPVAWKRRALRMALDATEPFRSVDPIKALQRPPEPMWPTGLEGIGERFQHFRGVVLVSGPPSSAKSVLAVASGVEAARSGWDVVYLSCEMPERIAASRIRGYAGEMPERFALVDVTYGATIETLLAWIEERVGERPTLIIFDSLSSFVDQSERGEEDTFGMGPLRRLVMWAINARRATEGQLSFMLLSEVNREGRAKGRMADHRADLAITMAPHEKYETMKTIRVTKGWSAPVGPLGDFALDVERWRLAKV